MHLSRPSRSVPAAATATWCHYYKTFFSFRLRPRGQISQSVCPWHDFQAGIIFVGKAWSLPKRRSLVVFSTWQKSGLTIQYHSRLERRYDQEVTVINFNWTSNSMIDAEFKYFEVSILIDYLFVLYRSSNLMSN